MRLQHIKACSGKKILGLQSFFVPRMLALSIVLKNRIPLSLDAKNFVF
jgi:hypothetical protein